MTNYDNDYNSYRDDSETREILVRPRGQRDQSGAEDINSYQRNAPVQVRRPIQYEAPVSNPPVYETKPRLGVFAFFLALFLVVTFALVYFFVPEDMGGIPGLLRKPGKFVEEKLLPKPAETIPVLSKFEKSEEERLAEHQALFRIKTDKRVESVRIEDGNGNAIFGIAEEAAEAENTWNVIADFEKGYEGKVYPAFKYRGEWHRSDIPLHISVAAAKMTAPPTFTQPPINLLANNGQVITPPAEGKEQSNYSLPASDGGAVDIDDNAVYVDEIGDIEEIEEAGKPAEDGKRAVGQEEDKQKENDKKAEDALAIKPSLSFAAIDDTKPSKFKLSETVFKNGRKQAKFKREKAIDLPAGEAYTSYEGGVFTFRGDNFRQNAAFGALKGAPATLSIVWEKKLGSLQIPSGPLFGLGWTGQPAIIKWTKEIRNASNIADEKKEKVNAQTGRSNPLKEVIVASQDGKVYFVDLEDGKETRPEIKIGFPLKGSVSVDSQGRPMIAFGQAASKLKNKSAPAGIHIYNLLNQKKLYLLEGRKNKNQAPFSTNSTFDGTPLFTGGASDSLVVSGENGLFYTVELNTSFSYADPAKMSLKIKPTTYYQKSKGVQKNADLTMESSVAMYGSHAFVADRHGIMRAIDTSSMKTVWAFDTGDNTDATPALDIGSDGKLALYTGNTVYNRQRSKKKAIIRRLDATNGKLEWEFSSPASYDKEEKSGVKASPIVGKGDIKDFVIFTINNGDGTAFMVALNKADGKEAWKVKIASAAISSPVAVYTENNESFIIQGTDKGHLVMLKGSSGEMVTSLNLGGKIEASPAVYNDMLVIGTCSKDPKLFGIRIQ